MACYGNGILQQLSNDKAAIVRNARSHVMAKVGIPVNIQTAIIANHDPDWADKDYVFTNIEKSNLFNCSKCIETLPSTGFKTDTL
jgi:hypothetical protein